MSQYSSPKIWGPHFWFIMRCVANNYPINPTKEDAKHVKNFFTELQYILPCDICKYTYRQHVKRNPIEIGLASRDKLIDWVEDIYNYTKKVIGDRRIKVMDPIIEESDGEMKPIKIVYKAKKTDLENKINDMAKHIKSKEIKIEQSEVSKYSSKTETKNSHLGKITSEKPKSIAPKYENRHQKKKDNSKIYKMDTKENFGKVSTGKKMDKYENNYNKRSLSTASEKPQYTNRTQITSSSHNRIKNMDPRSATSKELVLTRRCNKCEH